MGSCWVGKHGTGFLFDTFVWLWYFFCFICLAVIAGMSVRAAAAAVAVAATERPRQRGAIPLFTFDVSRLAIVVVLVLFFKDKCSVCVGSDDLQTWAVIGRRGNTMQELGNCGLMCTENEDEQKSEVEARTEDYMWMREQEESEGQGELQGRRAWRRRRREWACSVGDCDGCFLGPVVNLIRARLFSRQPLCNPHTHIYANVALNTECAQQRPVQGRLPKVSMQPRPCSTKQKTLAELQLELV